MALFGKKKARVNKMGNAERVETKMSETEVEEFGQLAKDILSDKRKGFIYMATTDGEEAPYMGEGAKHSNGVVYLHKASKMTMVMNLLGNLGINPTQLALLSMLEGKGKGKDGHHEDCDGTCNDED